MTTIKIGKDVMPKTITTKAIMPHNTINFNQNLKFTKKGADFMQLKKAEREKINARSGRFVHRIGSTVFTVNIYSKEGKTEKLEDKILRLMKNDLERQSEHGKMNLPQADWLPERSSV